jgi:antitoxin CptB
MTLGYDSNPCEVTDNAQSNRYINLARHVRAFGVDERQKMSASTRSSDGLDDRRKRLLFRCWHRGTKEMDYIFGRFADVHIADLSEEEVADFERLIDLPDPDLYNAFNDKLVLEPVYADGIFRRIKAFTDAGSSA